jgi:N-acetylglucosamine-6-sulfatase
MAGVAAPAEMGLDGRSFWPLAQGKTVPWRDHMIYEYYWEWNFPATPTTFALRTERYKFVYSHGVWDKDGLYDLSNDPAERHNLINVPAFREQAMQLRRQLFSELNASGGLTIPVQPPEGERLGDRKLRN